MKRLLLLAVFAASVLACGPSKTVTDSYKVMKGYWTLTDISYETSGRFNVTLFNDESASCFEGSSWRFIPNNNTGRYTIDEAGCASGERHFVFTVQEIDRETGLYDFMLKPTDSKGKSDDNRGIRMRLAQLDNQTMRWQQTVTVDGQPFAINLNFIKNE